MLQIDQIELIPLTAANGAHYWLQVDTAQAASLSQVLFPRCHFESVQTADKRSRNNGCCASPLFILATCFKWKRIIKKDMTLFLGRKSTRHDFASLPFYQADSTLLWANGTVSETWYTNCNSYKIKRAKRTLVLRIFHWPRYMYIKLWNNRIWHDIIL